MCGDSLQLLQYRENYFFGLGQVLELMSHGPLP
jgi:hypothetical protein